MPSIHLIVAHVVTNEGHDRHQLNTMAKNSKEAMDKSALTTLAIAATTRVKNFWPASSPVSRRSCPGH